MENHQNQTRHEFPKDERDALYKAIFNRRDVRGQFLGDPIPDPVLSRVLMAAHHAPSVGFMQPWNFILVRSPDVKKQIHDAFEKAHGEAAGMFDEKRRDTYAALKLEGIMESPLNICVTCDRERAGPVVIGRTHIKEMDLYSSVCAVQNLWLAARAEGLGVGWVSIIDQDKLKEILGLEGAVVPIAYLCIGYVDYFHDRPELEKAKWRKRLPLDELIYFDGWGKTATPGSEPILGQVRRDMDGMEKTFSQKS